MRSRLSAAICVPFVGSLVVAGILGACSSSTSPPPPPASDAGQTDATTTDATSLSDGAKDDTGTKKDGGDAGKHADAKESEAAAEAGEDAGDAGAGDGAVELTSLKHVVVIYLENHSFDNLFGSWPGADGLGDGGVGIPQVGPEGGAYTTLPEYAASPAGVESLVAVSLPNAPFDLTAGPAHFQEGALTNDLLHRFYQEQAQINGGKMDSYVLWNDESAGQSMGYWPTSTLPMPQWLAAHPTSVTLLDHFFHAAFGGSFLNHFWLISAQSPMFPGAPTSIVAQPNDAGVLVAPLDTTSVPPGAVYISGTVDGQVTPDGYAVNTTYSVNEPYPPGTNPIKLLPQQTFPTIADELDTANVTWAWYAGGWNDALANAGIATVGTDAGSELIGGGTPAVLNLFEYHHQPFVYFENWGGTATAAVDGGIAVPGTVPNGKWAVNHNLKDEEDFIAAAAAGTLPSVSFVKPLFDEHPNYTTETDSQTNTVNLINDVVNGPQWKETAIIITYDENGGQWDHVAPPTTDKWGPGTRVPGIIISPFAKGGVDSTPYDTTAILKLIEKRWGLAALTTRDAAQADLSTHAMIFAP